MGYGTYGSLLVIGILALIIVFLIYRNQKKISNPEVITAKINSESLGESLSLNINPLSSDVMKSHLSLLISDQPLFIHNVVNYLKRAKTASDIKLIKSAIEQISVQSDLIGKIGEYEELFYDTKGKQKEFERRDDISELTHERDKLRLLNEIEELKNPFPQPLPTTPQPTKTEKSKEQRIVENEKRKEAKANMIETKEKEWIKELSEDPNIANEDIPMIIERRKRARGWLDYI